MILPKNYSRGLSYQLYLPQGREADFVEQICEIQGKPDFLFERMMPSVSTEIIFNFNNKMKGKYADEIGELEEGQCLIQGSQFNYFDSYLSEGTHFFSIRFTNLGLRKLLNISPSFLVNSYIHNPQKSKIREVHLRMTEASSFEDRIRIFLNWLRPQLWTNNEHSLEQFIEQKIINYPFYNSKELEKMTGFTPKYLNRRFKAFTGYTISNFKRLCRFNLTLNHVRANRNHSWTDITYEQNFYDQSHFIKEMNFFTGVNPTVLKENLAGNHYNLIL